MFKIRHEPLARRSQFFELFLWASPPNEILLISPNVERPPFVFLRCRLRHWKEKFVKLVNFVVKKIRVIYEICGFMTSES